MTQATDRMSGAPDREVTSQLAMAPCRERRPADTGWPSGQQGAALYSAADLADALGRPRPTPEQTAVIEAPPISTLVVAGAGSGKTETMAARVVWMVANGWCRPNEVLGLTFTRKAASELGTRISHRLRLLASLGLTMRPVETASAGPARQSAAPARPWRREADGLLHEEADESEVLTYHGFAGRLLAEHGGWVGVDEGTRLLSEASAWQFAHQVVSGWDGPMNHVDISVAGATRAVVALSAELAEHLRHEDELDAYLADIDGRVSALPRGTSRGRGLPREVTLLLRGVRARRQLLPLVREYRALKRRHGALDFADQVSYASRMVAGVAAVSRAARQMYRVVLLDEVQDTSEAQMQLLRDLFVTSGPGRGAPVPVTAVGDPHQAIYGWRGASATTLQRFASSFGADGDVLVRHLSASWRNDEEVLAAANTVARPLREGSLVPVRRLVARPGAGRGRVDVARLNTLQDEADHVAAWLAARRAEGVTSAAVLCRRRSQIPLVVASLRQREIPVEVVGLGGLLTTPEVADVVALLAVAADPDRPDALMRLLTGPVCRLGAADLDGVAAWARAASGSAAEGLSPVGAGGEALADRFPPRRPGLSAVIDDLPRETWRGPDGERVSGTAVTRLTELARAVETVRARRGDTLLDQALAAERALALDIDVDSTAGAGPSAGRIALDAFLGVVIDFERSVDEATMEAFLDWLDVARVQERNLDQPTGPAQADAVQVMTVHGAKGLEWDAVAVPGLVEGVFPAYTARSRPTATSWESNAPTDKGWCSRLGELPYDLRGDRDALPRLAWRKASDLAELDTALQRVAQDGGEHLLMEERRLMYVAVTRARCHLLLTAPVWSEATTPRVTSRFLEELRVACHRTGDAPWTDMPDPTDPDAASNPHSGPALSGCWPPERRPPEPLQKAADLVESLLRQAPGADDQEPGPPRSLSGDRHDLIRALVAAREQANVAEPGDATCHTGRLSVSELILCAEDPGEFRDRRRRPVPRPPDTRARVGRDFHRRVEAFYREQAPLLEGCLSDPWGFEVTAAPGPAEREPASEISTWWEAFLASPWATRRPVACELPIDTVIGGAVIRGRIDAVFPGEAGGYVIVDWKTGYGPSGPAADEHALQLAAYRIAFARWAGVPAEEVRAAAFYAGSGQTHWFQLDGVDVAGMIGPETGEA